MHIVFINNDNFVATQPRIVVQYTMKLETNTKIYCVCKLNGLIYVRYVIFLYWTLCFIDFFWLCVLFYSYLETNIFSRLSS